MSASINASRTQHLHEQSTVDRDREIAIVNHLVEVVTGAGICKDPIDAVNFYVALKSKPLLILFGPPNSGKTALVQCLARILVGGDCSQCQMLVGHPWSAESSGNVSFFTRIHYRFNTEKMLSLIEEAWQPENRHRIFLACLTRISPAEIIDFFLSLSHQLSHERIYRIGDAHFPKPIPYPPNLWIIGTIDRTRFDWWDSGLLSHTMVVQWPELVHRKPSCPTTASQVHGAQIEFLDSLKRARNEVYKKFHSVSMQIGQSLQQFFELRSLLANTGIQLHDAITDEIVTYLANSWTQQGNGLFHPSNRENLSISLDLAIAQILLPSIDSWIKKSNQLNASLLDFFDGGSPRSVLFLKSY